MNYMLTFLSLIFLNQSLFSQIDSNAVVSIEKGDTILFNKLIDSDSILLISHDLPKEYAIKIIPDESTDKYKQEKYQTKPSTKKNLKLISKGRLNEKIIHKTILLNHSQRDSLIKIFNISLATVKEIQFPSRCFSPHHGIAIYKNDKISFLELCFGCRENATSDDIGLIQYFTKIRWNKLEDLYKNLGFKIDY